MKHAVLALAIFSSATAHALDPDRALTQYRHRSWTAENGLTESTVWALAQTRDGYLWIGGEQGLNRFDGVRFVGFDTRNTPGLHDNTVWTLDVDHDGALLVGTRHGALHRFAGGKMEPLFLDGKGPISCIYPARDGSLWFCEFGGGAHRLRNGEHLRLTTDDGLGSNKVNGIFVDERGAVFVATSGGGVTRVSGLDGGERRVTVFTTKDGLASDFIGAVTIAQNGDAWIQSYDRRITLYHDGRFRRVDEQRGLPAEVLVRMGFDRDGNTWLGYMTQGLVRFPAGEAGARDRLSMPTVMSILEDRERNLWIGTRGGGLHCLSEGKFTPFGTPEGIAQDVVIAVHQSRDGAIWLASLGGGLTRLTGQRAQITTTKDGLGSDTTLAFFERPDGATWLGQYAAGVDEFRDGRVRPIQPKVRSACAFAEASDGSVIAGTRGFGAWRIRGDEAQPLEGVPSEFVPSVVAQKDGTIWLGTHQGLVRRRDDSSTVLRAKDGLAGDQILALLDDGDALWVGTAGGLSHVGSDGAIWKLTVADGLCHDTINQILDDGLGFLWLAGPRGISRVPRASLRPGARVECRAFDTNDGLRAADTQGEVQQTALRAHDGTLWFATTRGAVTIDPKRAVERDPKPPSVAIERLRVDRAEVPLSQAREIAPGRGELELQFTALSFTAPDRVRFRYKLEGYDREWTEAGTRRTAYYTNLPPGDYRFRVSACNHDGVWNEAGAILNLRLHPHFYQTKWFFGLCALAALLAVLAIFRARVAALRARARELARLVDERTAELRRTQSQLVQSEKMSALGQLVAGVAHELNNPVNFITTNIDFLEERYRQLLALAEDPRVADRAKEIDLPFLKEDSPDLLRAFRHGAERIAAIVDNLQRFSRVGESTVKPTDLADGLRATLRMLEPMLKEGVSVQLDLEKLPPVECNPSLINQVFMNLLVNAAQAMKGRGEIRVSGRVDGDFAEIEVSDSGPGVPRELREKIFEPFFTTKDPGQGTGLGLSISYRIVSEHGGSLAVVDGEGGARFGLRLPLRRVAP